MSGQHDGTHNGTMHKLRKLQPRSHAVDLTASNQTHGLSKHGARTFSVASVSSRRRSRPKVASHGVQFTPPFVVFNTWGPTPLEAVPA